MTTLTPDDFDYDTDMGCLSIDLDKFAQDDDATPYDSFHRLQEQLLENQKGAEQYYELKAKLDKIKDWWYANPLLPLVERNELEDLLEIDKEGE